MIRHRTMQFYLALFAGVACIATAANAQTTRYVDQGATGTGDGLSWPNAFNYLQDALAASSSGDQIWVATGTYRPDQSAGNPGGTDDPAATFALITGVAVYGGFDGTEISFEERAALFDQAILSGDIGIAANSTDNCYHVVTGSGTNATAVLDGFTVTDGNANGTSLLDYDVGGGVYNDVGSPSLSNCTFTGNSADYGGGMYNDIGSPSLVNCTFTGNSADYGGGMYNDVGSPSLVNCTFEGNSAAHGAGMYNYASSPDMTDCAFDRNSAGSSGGGMYNGSSSSPTLTSCIFTGNTSGHYGGGMSNLLGNSNPILRNCLFSGNTAVEGGGAMRNDGADPTLINCTFSANEARELGGALSNADSSLTVTNCILWDNIADSDGGAGGPYMDEAAQIDGGTPIVTYSCIQGCSTFCTNPDDHNVGGDPLFVRAPEDGADNVWGTADDDFGDLHFTLGLYPASPCIDSGDNTVVTTSTDLDGEPRMVNDLGHPWEDPPDEPPDHSPIVDMGAYEFQETSITPRLYVDVDATGSNTGTSWSDAFVHLQDALAIASTWPDIVNEIWVAEGTYMPDGGRVTADDTYYAGTGNRAANFSLLSKVAIYGGFAGTETARAYCSVTTGQSCLRDSDCPMDETCDDARDFGYCFGGTNAGDRCDLDADCDSETCRNLTILSGDLNDDDGPDLFVQDFAACFSGSGVPLDLEEGCNVFDLDTDNDVDPTDLTAFLSDNHYVENSHHVVYAASTADTAILNGFTVVAGYAEGTHGGGLLKVVSDASIRNCGFVGNSASGYGGAIYAESCWDYEVTDCRFVGNVTPSHGGAIYTSHGSDATVTDCLFQDNATNDYGGAIHVTSSLLILADSVFVANTARSNGGAIYIQPDIASTMNNCRFQGNKAGTAGAVSFEFGTGGNTLTDCDFLANSARSDSGAMYNNWGGAGYLHIHGCSFVGNAAQSSGGAITNRNTHAVFYDTIFADNYANGVGGAIYNNNGSRPELIRCMLVGNRAASNGGAIVDGNGDTSLTDCLVVGNQAALDGGAVWHNGSTGLVLLNSTAVANEAIGLGGGVYNAQVTTITNSILWANVDAGGMVVPAQVDGNDPVVNHSCFQDDDPDDPVAFPGTCNIDDDPAFVSKLTGTWTGAATYDEDTEQTTFFHDSVEWPGVDPVKNRPLLNPDNTQYLQAIIVATDTGQITVWGDFRDLAGLGPIYNSYEVNDYRLGPASPCIDAANNAAMIDCALACTTDGDCDDPLFDKCYTDIGCCGVGTDLCGETHHRFLDDPSIDDCWQCPGLCGTPPPPIVDMGAHEYDLGCVDETDCNDENPCTYDNCIDNMCQHPPNDDASCDHENLCVLGDHCESGNCVGTPIDCEEEPCMIGVCNPSTGSCDDVPVNEGGWCKDDEPCTINFTCVSGVCTGAERTCNDGNPCTDDWCEDLGGGAYECHNDCTTDPCDDLDACTEGDTCTMYEDECACLGTPKNCDDGNLCTEDWCEGGVCMHSDRPELWPCDDGDICTGTEACDGYGNCISTLIDCNGNETDDHPSCLDGFATYLWDGLDGGSFTHPGNWYPGHDEVPGANALLRNDEATDNRCILSDPAEQVVCGLTVEATGEGVQVLEIQQDSSLTATQDIEVGTGGKIQLVGGELASVYGEANVTGTISGYGTVTVDVVNGGIIEIATGETLVFNAGLTNDPGVITLTTSTLIASGVTNNVSANISGSGTIESDVVNDGQITVIADMLIEGSLDNNGNTVILSGELTVNGGLSGSGAVSGSFSGARSGNGLAVAGNYAPGPDATLDLVNATVSVAGNFDAAINDNEHYDMVHSELRMVGLEESTVQYLEVMSTDIGRAFAGLDRTQPGRYPLHTLRIAAPFTTVEIVDTHDNDGLGQTQCEAIYAEYIIVEAGATLTIPEGCTAYCVDLTNDGTVIGDVQLIIPCTASAPQAELLNLPDWIPEPYPISQKIRHLSFNAGDAGVLQGLRITFGDLPTPYDHWSGTQLWVQEPVRYCENAGQAEVPEPSNPPDYGCGSSGDLEALWYWAAALGCDPHWDYWTAYDFVHVYDEGIIPEATYNIQVLDSACSAADEGNYSDSLTLTQSVWADLVKDCSTTPCGPPNDSGTGIVDVTAIMDKWKNLPGNVIKVRADIEGSPAGDHRLPDQAINITDVTYCLGAFLGDQYPPPGFPPPSDPPVCP